MAWIIASAASSAAIIVPGADGSDDELVVTQNREIDLSDAVTANWDHANSGGDVGKGVYDAAKWAVVFKYSRVYIGANATVTFINHPSRAPVVWLVSGEVVVDGTVSLNAGPTVNAPHHSEPGPGGFRGGMASLAAGVSRGPGFGIGGGAINTISAGNVQGFGGSYGTAGSGPGPYGNASLVPLIGGSGGGGYNAENRYHEAGGGGGGAILVASQTSIGGTGLLLANGRGSFNGGGGSGGGIRLVTDVFTGALQLQAVPGVSTNQGRHGGVGRIRIERVTDSASPSASSSPAPTVGHLSPGATAVIWPPDDAPSVRIVSVGGTPAPTDPRGGLGTTGGDLAVPATATTRVVLETVNVGENWTVIVRGTPEVNSNFVTANAVVESVLGNSPLTIRWQADLQVAEPGYMAFQARVIRP